MRSTKDLTSLVFGKLTVIGRVGSNKGRANWMCSCQCGKTHHAVSHALTSGHTKSCGCWKDERNTSTQPTHGHASRKGLSPTYQSWRGMWTRCTNPKAKGYENYGGRGISICKSWETFENFLDFMGERPSNLTLDRINVNGNYEPNNCKWSTRSEQNKNTQRHASKLGDEVHIPKELL